MKKLFFFLAAIAVAFTANAKVTTISPDAENDALRLAVHYAEDGDIIEMNEGTYVQCNNGYVDFDGKSVTVKAAEGANVVLQLQVPITLTNGGKATLQGIKIDASRLLEKADWYEHVVYPTDATEGKQLVMDGCELYGFNINKSAIYSKADNKLDLCSINNCYFHDNMKSCLFFEGASIAELSVVNSTFANIATDASGYYAGIIDVRNADAKVTVDHCTFYNCLLLNTDYAAITMKGPQAANVVISNNIFMLPEAIDGHRAIRENVGATNCMTFNYVKDNGGIHSSVTKTSCQLNVDPKFVDATKGNFALAEGSPALTAGTDGKAIGDPRWNVVAEPEPTTETVYFIDVKKWGKVNAYAWNTNGDNGWPGKAATKEAEQIAGFDVYSFTANAGQYANVIFNNKVGDTGSQTPDLVWTAGKYYVIDMDWLTKEEAEATLAAPLPDAWNIVGDAGLMGKGWDLNAAENAMTLQADGTYLLEKKDITITAGSYEYKAAKDHGWDVSVPAGSSNQKLTISKSGIYDVTFVLDVTAKKLTATATLKKEAVVIPTVIIAGDMNSWNQTKDKFTMAADSLTATFKATLTAKSYAFKMIVGGAWLSDGNTITRAANSTKFTGANSSTNSTLKADIAGEYLFTWEYATKTLTVTYPALPVKYNVTVTAENGTVAGAGEYEEGKTATLTATPAEGYEFVNWTVGEEVVSTENPYTFPVTADAALVANFKEVVVEPTYDWDVEAKDLYVNANEVMTQIEGSNSFNPDMMISVTLFATGYGKYTSAGTDNDQFNAYYMGYPILGELTYSYSEELKSDLVVIIGTMTDEENITSTVRITMYEEYLEPTDVVVLNNLTRVSMGSGPWASLMLSTARQDTIITISGCDGTYGKYTAFGTFGTLELEGKGEWKNDGENDVFVGVLYNADKTKVFQVTASTPAEAAPEAKEYRFEVSNIDFFIDLEGDFYIYCASEEDAEVPFNLELILYGWKGAGNYGIGEMAGTIYTIDYMDGAAVANMSSEIEVIVEDGKVIIIGQVEDADGNIYNLSLEGAEPQVDDDDPTTGVENLNGTVAPVKVIENGQIFIIRNGVKYNAQGAKL